MAENYYKETIKKAHDSKKAVRAIGLINSVRLNKELDENEKNYEIEMIVESYNDILREKWSVS